MTGRLARVKAALRSGEVCALADLYGDFLANGRNDLSMLRRERGWGIDSWWTVHEEGPAHCHYRLTDDPEQVRIFQSQDAEQPRFIA